MIDFSSFSKKYFHMKINPLHEFTVSISKEVDQINTRIEGDKTITETVKATKVVNIPFCIKVPSRPENEEADIVRAVWWTKFMERGVVTEAALIKKYTNDGGTLPDEDKKLLEALNLEFIDVQMKLKEAEILNKDEPEILRPLRIKFFDIREEITKIHRSQAPYFENTAEAKAREKHIQWLVLNMSYFKPHQPDESQGEWQPFFVGKTMEEKLTYFDSLVEKRDELWVKARGMLELIAALYSSSNGRITGEEIANFALEDALENPQ